MNIIIWERRFSKLDWKEQGYPRTLGNKKGLKELAISKAWRTSGEPEVIWKTEKEQKVSQKFLENQYYFQLVVIIFLFLEILCSIKVALCDSLMLCDICRDSFYIMLRNILGYKLVH